MNNGRDCPHGRQVGRCDTCDLIRAELELERVTAERDALAVQVNAAFADVFLLSKSLFEAADVLEREFLPALEDKEPLEELIAEFRRALGKSPEAHLAAHDAEVAKAAFMTAINEWVLMTTEERLFCTRVEMNPYAKHACSPHNNYESGASEYPEPMVSFWKNAQSLKFIEAVGSYKWIVTEKYKRVKDCLFVQPYYILAERQKLLAEIESLEGELLCRHDSYGYDLE